MSSRLSGAIEELEEVLREQLEEVANTKKLINSLLKRSGEPERYGDVSIAASGATRSDEFYGKTVTGAAQTYLERVHRATPVEEINKALEAGGFDYSVLGWTDAGRVRNVAISLAKNPKTFHKLPNGTWGLSAWYPNVQPVQAAKKTVTVVDPTAPYEPAQEPQEEI